MTISSHSDIGAAPTAKRAPAEADTSVWIFVVLVGALGPKITRAKSAGPTAIARPFPKEERPYKREGYRHTKRIIPKWSAHFAIFLPRKGRRPKPTPTSQ